MRTRNRKLRLAALLIVALVVLTVLANAGAGIPDKRLVGDWHGQTRFGGMSYEEITSHKVAAQNVESALTIAADGTVTGRVGGANLIGCTVKANRGWFGRMLHIKTDFIITGKIAGPVAPGSTTGTNDINAPFNLKAGQIDGTMFTMRGAFSYPYPFLQLKISH